MQQLTHLVQCITREAYNGVRNKISIVWPDIVDSRLSPNYFAELWYRSVQDLTDYNLTMSHFKTTGRRTL